MLIKLYINNDVDSETTLHIIEHARCVRTYNFLYEYNMENFKGPSEARDTKPTIFHSNKTHVMPKHCRVIDYLDERDIHRRILVTNKAYICNDAGQTVEVVKV